MKNLLIYGINGKMGRIVADLAKDNSGYNIYGFDLNACPDYTTFCDTKSINVAPDIIIDFSRAEAIGNIAEIIKKFNCPVVLATTGYSPEQEKIIQTLAKSVAVFKSGNMSVGVNAILNIITEAAKKLDGFDIEIVEKHHNQKADAPSGTAMMMAKAANFDGTKKYTYGREGKSLRDSSEIGIHAVRGGTIIGEHDIIFAGLDETVTISHTALSRKIFAVGALKAAAAILSKPAGLYSFANI